MVTETFPLRTEKVFWGMKVEDSHGVGLVAPPPILLTLMLLSL